MVKIPEIKEIGNFCNITGTKGHVTRQQENIGKIFFTSLNHPCCRKDAVKDKEAIFIPLK